DGRGDDATVAAGQHHRADQVHTARSEQRERRREREPVDRRRAQGGEGHGSACLTVETACEPANDRSVIAAGHAERTSRIATSGTTIPSSAGRRSSAASVTAGPGERCSTAEISRSMYIAASTIAIAPTTAQPQPVEKTPARIRNSPANADEPGTASAMIPV